MSRDGLEVICSDDGCEIKSRIQIVMDVVNLKYGYLA